MGSGKSVLSTNVIEQITEIASREAVRAFREELKEQQRRVENRKVSATRRMLQSYRRVKAQVRKEAKLTEDEMRQLRWKFLEYMMGDPFSARSAAPDQGVVAENNRRRENLYAVHRIEDALKLYKKEVGASKNEEKKRRFRAMYDLYFSKTEVTIEEIAAKEGVSEKTAYRDVREAVEIMSDYIMGF